MNMSDLISTIMPILAIFMIFITMAILTVFLIDMVRRRKGSNPATINATKTRKVLSIPPTDFQLASTATVPAVPFAESTVEKEKESVILPASATNSGDNRSPSFIKRIFEGVGRLGSRVIKRGNAHIESKPETPATSTVEEVEKPSFERSPVSPLPPTQPEAEPIVTPSPIPASTPSPSPLATPSPLPPTQPEAEPIVTPSPIPASTPPSQSPQQEPVPDLPKFEAPESPIKADDGDGEIKIKPLKSLAEAKPIITSKIKSKMQEEGTSAVEAPSTAPPPPVAVRAPPASKPASVANAAEPAVSDMDNVREMLDGGAQNPAPVENEQLAPKDAAKTETKVESPQQASEKTNNAVYVQAPSTPKQSELASSDVPALLYSNNAASVLTKEDVSSNDQTLSSQLNELRDSLKKLNIALKQFKEDENLPNTCVGASMDKAKEDPNIKQQVP
jgi:hypothetical protein